jgi:diguanylate cyclase (GGDEF)-like protein
MRQSGTSPIGASRWVLRSLPRPVLAVILAVELVAVAAVVLHLPAETDLATGDWAPFAAVLVAAGILSTEASLGVERIRHRPEGHPHIDLSSVWTFAAAALLPGIVATAVVVAVYAHLQVRIGRRSGVPLHRAAFTTATVVLAVQAVHAVTGLVEQHALFGSVAGLGVVVLGVLAYAAVNMVLVVAVIVLSGPSRDFPTFLQLLTRGDEAALEFATLSMGALAAGAMASFGPAYALLVLPPLIVLHRTVLVRQLEEAASTDSKTGLLNAAAWHLRAGRALQRTERTDGHVTVLVLDLDHFKLVNDRYGHLVGDQVLLAVASAVRAEVRDDDAVGRFGGEEFVVLLRGVDGEDGRAAAVAVAERIRRRVGALRVAVAGLPGGEVVAGLTVSIGAATHPTDGTDLAALLDVADTAMYAAKRAGRNTVRIGMQPVVVGIRSDRTRPTPYPRR